MTTTTHVSDRRASAPAVRVDGLTKRYGDRAAVSDLTLEIPTGVVAGFIGPNGAGKTTTMAMLLGLVAPTDGTGEVLGEPLTRPHAYLGRVGAMVEEPAFWPGLTGTQNLKLVATLAGHDARRIADVLGLVGLSARADDRFGHYSLGMKQRLGIAAALLGDPDLLILDEPTNGLDPAGISEMRRLITEVGRGGRTVLVSSHILSELEQVCDWLILIDEGSLVYEGSADGFLGQAVPVVSAWPEDPADVLRLSAVAREAGLDVDGGDGAVVLPVTSGDGRADAADLNRAAIGAGIVLAELTVRRPTLETHYLALVEGANR